MQVYGAERDRLFAESAKLMPLFTDYQNKTKRQLPLLTLTRIDGRKYRCLCSQLAETRRARHHHIRSGYATSSYPITAHN